MKAPNDNRQAPVQTRGLPLGFLRLHRTALPCAAIMFQFAPQEAIPLFQRNLQPHEVHMLGLGLGFVSLLVSAFLLLIRDAD